MHNIDMTNERANIAFLGSKNDVWHRLGTEMAEGMSVEQWATAAGLDWQAIKCPAYARVFEYTPKTNNATACSPFVELADRFFLLRSDTSRPLGENTVSRRYHVVQPAELLDWFHRYIAVDDRFALDVAGSLNGGATIWATAVFREPLSVAGEKHQARVLMSTTFDGSGSTINQCTMTRVVCQNTLHVATMDKRAVVRTRHNTQFDAKSAGIELASLARGFAQFAKVGDALALHYMTKDDLNTFFRHVLDIPLDADWDKDVSTRKKNQFVAIGDAYETTIEEGAPRDSAWAALNAVTRYVDHDRPSTKASDEHIVTQTQFGSGAAIKAKATGLITELLGHDMPN